MAQPTRLMVVGVNHTTAEVGVRERLAFTVEEAATFMRALLTNPAIGESAVLATCNRVEVYLAASHRDRIESDVTEVLCQHRGIAAATLHGAVYVYEDDAAVRHLFRVASSLDSMVLGEPHILGQVREAHERAGQSETIGPLLNRLLNRAVQIGKKVRNDTEISSRPVSISSVAVDLAGGIFGSLERCRVLVLGAGEMSRLTVGLLQMRGVSQISVANRSADRGLELAAQYGGEFIAWDGLSRALAAPDIVLSSVAAEGHVVTRAMLDGAMKARSDKPLFLIDLSVPRSIEPAASELYNVFLYDIDDFNEIAAKNMRERERYLPAAEQIVEDGVEAFERWRSGLSALPTIRSLREKIEAIRDEQLAHHLRRMDGLSDHDRHVVEALAHAITSKILHDPTIRLRQASDEGLIESVRYLFDIGDDLEESGRS